jgi:hypothetical protein
MKKVISLFEILIMVIGIFSFTFIVGGSIPKISAEEINIGCCYDKSEGLCSPNSLEESCLESENSEWKDDSKCNIPECNLGCCYLGLDGQFVTQGRCSKLSSLFGVPGRWDNSITDESECIASLGNQENGACILGESNVEDGNLCKFTTREECVSLTGNSASFNKDKLCSHPDLNTVCERQVRASCFENYDEIYWVDSCGNRENIYSSNKDASWNSGNVLSKEESCNPNSDNINSASCGNCNYGLGSVCGDFSPGDDRGNIEGLTCKDLNCKNAPDHAGKTKDRLNGESWCVYDSQIGNLGIGPIGLNLSIDPVGSRHYRYICVNGEVEVEPCADYRKEVCVENEKDLEGKKISDALCKVNTWEQCLGYNSGGACELGCLANCANNEDCRVQNVDVDKNFKFNTCVPKYPPGFDLENSGAINTGAGLISNQLGMSDLFSVGQSFSGGTSGSQICGLGTKTCTSVWVKQCPGGWTCVDNCDCHGESFTTQMNNLCVSLGDCGVYTNWVGRPTIGGARVTKEGKHGRTPMQPYILAPIYIVFAKAIAGQKAGSRVFTSVGAIANLPWGIVDPFLRGYSSLETGEPPSQLGNMFGDQLGTTLGFAGAGGLVGGIGAVGLQLAPLWPIFVGVAVVLGAMYAMGCGKVETVEITFSCEQWQRPALFTDCEKCNEDPYKPCTKYKCESLGSMCGMVNEGTDFGACVKIDDEEGSPVISPWEEVLNESYKYQTISTNGFEIRKQDGGCIQAFTPLLFGVETNIFAQCKISTSRDFENSSWSWFLEGELYMKNHTYATYLPSVESIIWGEVSSPSEYQRAYELAQTETITNELGEQQIYYEYLLEQVGDLNFFVKCNGLSGMVNEQDYKINFCVDPGPDRTPPAITATSPAKNDFVRYDATEQKTQIYVTEPSDCKWTLTKPVKTNMLEVFREMENNFECEQSAEGGGLLGYKCETTLPITEDENNYYFLCRDQPWLGENEERNVGADSGKFYEYNLKKTKNELKVDSVSPSGKITRGQEPIEIELRAKTSGGIDNGKSICRYEFEGEEFGDRFLETDSNEHVQILTSMMTGNYKVKVFCRDEVGNVAEDITEFELELDTQYPEVSRVYNQGGSLFIVTTEDATCYFTKEENPECNLNSEKETMDGASSMFHNTEWDSESVHYIICEDIWGNKPNSCSIIVKPEDLRKT